MFKRKLLKHLLDWKSSPVRKPLILRGARQVGKTSLVRDFATQNYAHYLEINLENKKQLSLFDSSQTAQELLDRSSAYFNQSILPDETLLFIDEVQESANIMSLLRFFSEEIPALHLIVAGSLLEAKLQKDFSFPVGRVDYLYLYPLTFFEYLVATGQDILLAQLTTHTTLNHPSHELATELFKKYLSLGGMPAIVQASLEPDSIRTVPIILNRLHTSYLDDIHKYASSSNSKYFEKIIEYAPQIAGALYLYNNFGYSSFHTREISEAMHLLEKIMLLHEIQSLNSTSLPLSPKPKRAKKMIWLDFGLVSYANNFTPLTPTPRSYSGQFMEQVVGQTILSLSPSRPLPLYYWAKDHKDGSAEVDFCFQSNQKVIAVEVKSGDSQKMKSLFSLSSIDSSVILVRISWDPLGIEHHHYHNQSYQILSIPFYLMDRILELVDVTT